MQNSFTLTVTKQLLYRSLNKYLTDEKNYNHYSNYHFSF